MGKFHGSQDKVGGGLVGSLQYREFHYVLAGAIFTVERLQFGRYCMYDPIIDSPRYSLYNISRSLVYV